MNLEYIRSLFPVTKEAVYLNSASQSPLNTLVYDKLQTYLKTEISLVDKKGFNRDEIRILLSKLLGGSPEEYALTTSTGVGLGIVAQGLDLKKGDNIIIPEREHWNNTFPWLNLEKKGVEIRFAKVNEDNRIDSNEIEKRIDSKTRVIAIAAVRFNSGYRPNLSIIGDIAHRHNALFVVDAAQGAGMIPIDVEKDKIDVMSGCGFKWLLGMHGTGFLYVSNRVAKRINPVLPGMFAAKTVHDSLSYYDDSRKFETGTIAYPLFSGWIAGLQLILDIGVETIYNNALENTEFLMDGILEKGYRSQTPIGLKEERTAIIHFNTGSYSTTEALFKKLKEHNVLTTLQGDNIRVSPNFFTSKEDIDRFLNLL